MNPYVHITLPSVRNQALKYVNFSRYTSGVIIREFAYTIIKWEGKIMKKIVVVLGSPRKKGNSAILAYSAIEGIIAANGIYEVFYLNGMNIRPCQACELCKSNSNKKCIINDDMQLIYPKLDAADSLLLASPIYMFSVTAQLKLFMDRCHANTQALSGKKIGILLTYGDPNEKTSGVMNAVNTLTDEYNYTHSRIVGILYGSANEKGTIVSNTQLMGQAFELGKMLAE